MSPLYWVAILGVLIIVEICTLALTTIWFAGGAFAALIASLITDNLALECGLFVAVSAVLLLILRPSVVRRFNRRRAKTNVEAVAGKTVRVIEPVDNIANTGRVAVDGMEWAARSSVDGTTFDAGENAVVVRVEGVKMIIEKEA
ncbi:MAG: NfeD family protein [Lachnospiraceae bacterium]|nr:NfeD family protein [Lachnospiraceae bacterium]